MHMLESLEKVSEFRIVEKSGNFDIYPNIYSTYVFWYILYTCMWVDL